MKKRIKQAIKKIEKLEKKKFYKLCSFIFVVSLFLGLIIGYGINAYRIYQLKRYQAKVEKEMRERLTKKLERYQLQLR